MSEGKLHNPTQQGNLFQLLTFKVEKQFTTLHSILDLQTHEYKTIRKFVLLQT